MHTEAISTIFRKLPTLALVCSTSALLASAPLAAQTKEVPMPPDAPSVNCEITPSTDASTLHTLSAPATFIYACNKSQEHPTCYAEQATGEFKNSSVKRLIAAGQMQGRWTCAFYDGVPGWMPTAALAPLPTQPASPVMSWIGYYRQGKPVPGMTGNRLLIQPGKTAGTLHISGRAFWYGLNDNVHFGEVNADAMPIGRYLHVVDGNGQGACVLDLVLNPSTHTLAADDNENCGGMNVRFWGQWNRFAPSTGHNK
jgi:hypothetical protein